MPKLKWDDVGKKLFETGVKNGVLYVAVAGAYPTGVAWNGLTALNEQPSGAEPTPIYADDIEYANVMSTEKFGGTIEAYTYPDEFAACDGSAELVKGVKVGQQTRKTFGLAYKTTIGNDVDGVDHGYKIHLVYGALAKPTEKSYQTINETAEAITFSWEFVTTPVSITGLKASAHIEIDSTTVDATKLAAFEDILFGKDGEPGAVARLPLPDEVKTLLTPTAG